MLEITINSWEGVVRVSYYCDVCKGLCKELHPKENHYLFRCRKCKIEYILNKTLQCMEYEVGDD